MTDASHAGRNAGLAGTILVIVIIMAGFLIYVPVTSAVAFPVVIVNTSTVTYVTSSVAQVPVTNQVPVTQSVLGIVSTTLQPNYYVDSSAQLNTGTDASVTWSSDDSVDVYVFDSSQFSAYTQSGNTSPNIMSQTGQMSGTLGWHVTFSDIYYVVLHNPHTGFLGIGAHNIQVTNQGSETYLASQTTYITQVITYTTSSLATLSSTVTSTTTKSCSYSFWSWVVGSKSCP